MRLSVMMALTFSLLAPSLSRAEATAPQPDLVSTLNTLAPVLKSHQGLKGFPSFNNQELIRAEKGEVVTRDVPIDDSVMPLVMIATVLPYPVEAVYLVIADVNTSANWIPHLDHATIIPEISEKQVVRAFHYASAPFPAQNRGWVIKNTYNQRLYEKSAGKVWEIFWEVDFDATQALLSGKTMNPVKSLDQDDLNDVVTPKVSTGAWTLIPLGDKRTYVEYKNLTNPNASFIEKVALSAIGSSPQINMFKEGLIPEAKAYSTGTKSTPHPIVSISGQKPSDLTKRLTQLSSTP